MNTKKRERVIQRRTVSVPLRDRDSLVTVGETTGWTMQKESWRILL